MTWQLRPLNVLGLLGSLEAHLLYALAGDHYGVVRRVVGISGGRAGRGGPTGEARSRAAKDLPPGMDTRSSDGCVAT